MSENVPRFHKQWYVDGRNGFDSLILDEKAVISKVGNRDVLVKLQGASLNYRDLIIPMGRYPFPLADGKFVPGSDGAGTVVRAGEDVRRFKPGDKVITLFNQGHMGGDLDGISAATGLGGALDGAFREFGSFEENGLVKMPKGLTFPEASCLTCAGLTAWNGLYGLTDRQVKPGDWVLTQGTGGVSLFAIQSAKAVGARVVATTGSPEKAEILKRFGADHTINYKDNPEWGKTAKVRRALVCRRFGRGFVDAVWEMTGGIGMNHIIEVAGPKSMQHSLDSVAVSGVISIIGFVGGNADDKEPGFLNVLQHICIVRGILVGSRVQMVNMCNAVEANLDKLRPVTDGRKFSLSQLKEAYEHQWSAKHIGKVVIDIES